jgi:hypothetical protein
LTSPGCCFFLDSRTQRNAAWHSNFPFNRDRYGSLRTSKSRAAGRRPPMIQADDGRHYIMKAKNRVPSDKKKWIS